MTRSFIITKINSKKPVSITLNSKLYKTSSETLITDNITFIDDNGNWRLRDLNDFEVLFFSEKEAADLLFT